MKRWLLPLSIRCSDLRFDRVKPTTVFARHQGKNEDDADPGHRECCETER